MAQEVGSGYVKITADGDGINEEIVDSVGKAGPDIEKEGEKHGEAYGEKFGEGYEDRWSKTRERISGEFNKRFAEDGGVAGDGSAKNFGKKFESVLDRIGGDIGDEFAHRLSDSITNEIESTVARQLDDLETRVDSITKGMSRAGGGGGSVGGAGVGGSDERPPQTLYKGYDFYSLFETARTKTHKEANAAIEKDDQNLLKDQESLYDHILKMESSKADFLGKFEAARVKLHKQNNDAIEKDDALLAKAQQSLMNRLADDDSFSRGLEKARQKIGELKIKPKLLDFDSAEVKKAEFKLASMFSRMDDIKANIDLDIPLREKAKLEAELAALKLKTNISIGDIFGGNGGRNGSVGRSLGDRLGGMFGAGSRNNALNILGKSMAHIIGSIATIGRGAASMGKAFTEGFSQATEGANIFQKVWAGITNLGSSGASGIGGIFTKIAKSGPGAVAAIAAVGLAGTLLVSILSSLLGVVTALVSTIASGLVGALAVGSGGILAMVAAGGLLVDAFLSMDKAQKTILKNDFTKVKDELAGIGQIMIKDMVPSFKTWTNNIEHAVVLMGPLAQVMGKAFAKAGDIFTKSLSGPGFRNFLNALTVDLPGITVKLSQSFGRFLNGVLGMFSAVIPEVRTFASYLDRVSAAFSKWANSAKGQNEISDFVRRALTSLKSLWSFLGQVGGLISDLLFNRHGQKAGNTMFDGLTDSLKRFRKYIAGGGLKKWFSEAETTAKNLGSAIASLAAALSKFRSDGTMDDLSSSLKSISGFLDKISPAFSAFGNAVSVVMDMIKSFLSPLSGLISLLGKAWDFISKIRGGGNAKPVSGGANRANTETGTNVVPGQSAAPAINANNKAISAWNKTLKDTATTIHNLNLPGFSKDLKTLPNQVQTKITTPGALDSIKSVTSLTQKYSLTPKQIQTVIKLLGQEGALKGVTELGRQYGLTPKQLKTIVSLLGVDSSKSAIAAISRAYNLTPKQVTTILKAETGNALTAVQRLKAQLDSLHNKTVYVTVARGNAGQANKNQKENPSGFGNPRRIMPSRGSSFGRLIGGPGTGASIGGSTGKNANSSIQDLINSGANALNSNHSGSNATKAIKKHNSSVKKNLKKYKNPYVQWAHSLIKNGPSIAYQIRKAITTANKQAASGLSSAARSDNLSDLRSGLSDVTSSMASGAQDIVSTARDALNNAAQNLASAKTKKAVKKALKSVKAQQKNMRNALKDQQKIQKAARMVAAQEKTTSAGNTLGSMISGLNAANIVKNLPAISAALKKSNLTLADFAKNRALLATKLDAANQQLQDAITIRNDYAQQVTQSIETFGALTTAQAQTINGVQQALNANDVVGNLQSRLAQIQDFQKNLNILLAEGLSQDAYKQLVDAGVDGGSAYATAIVQGGAGAVAQINSLTSQIDSVATTLGTDASNRLYQAGVDAAQGLVDGLSSLSTQLNNAATKLGNTIADAVKKALGIHSPSTVMIRAMQSVGDGGVIGMASQERRWSDAAGKLASKINVSPEVAAYAARAGQPSTVSGNGQVFRDLIVNTPTKDPRAVAVEAVNEMVGRL